MPVKTVDVSAEYGKCKELKKEDVEALQQWVGKQPHLPQMSELQIALFLHSCYCKLEATKTTIEAFFSFKNHFTDVFANRDPNQPQLKESMECGMFAQLPKKNPDGYRVLFFTFVEGDPAKFIPTDQMKLYDMSVRLWLEEDGTAEGLIFVIDVKKLTFGHIARIGISSLKNFFTYLQDALPVRLKGLYFVNAGGAAERLMNLVKPFIKPELNDMLHLLADISETFFKVVPQECLPSDYGGTADSVSNLHVLMKKKLLDNTDYFIEEEKQKATESKRINTGSSYVTPDYGVDGSFKKLEID